MMVFQDYSRARGSHKLSLTRNSKNCGERIGLRIHILTTVPFLEANLLPRSKFAKAYALARKTLDQGKTVHGSRSRCHGSQSHINYIARSAPLRSSAHQLMHDGVPTMVPVCFVVPHGNHPALWCDLFRSSVFGYIISLRGEQPANSNPNILQTWGVARLHGSKLSGAQQLSGHRNGKTQIAVPSN